MKLSFKLYMKLSSNQLAIVEELSYNTSKLYNIANYECRENGSMSYRKMNDFFRTNWHKEYLHSHTYQQMLRVLEKDWKSFFKALEDYNRNPHKYKGKPAPKVQEPLFQEKPGHLHKLRHKNQGECTQAVSR